MYPLPCTTTHQQKHPQSSTDQRTHLQSHTATSGKKTKQNKNTNSMAAPAFFITGSNHQPHPSSHSTDISFFVKKRCYNPPKIQELSRRIRMTRIESLSRSQASTRTRQNQGKPQSELRTRPELKTITFQEKHS